MTLKVRAAEAADLDFLAAMLAEAAFWRPSEPRESVDEVLRRPELAHYVAGWPRPGDRGLIAEYETDVPVGAAWLRFFPEADPGYGFVDAAVPELSMGVVPSARGQGVGRRLLKGLIDASRSAGLPGISLSVETDNYARRLYEQAGFRPVGLEEGGAVTMQLSFW
ncbi:GNAT family N-acetyltransferase [Arthrobacter castelli]|uniref:GNAT family N-acetyltransferase n=1 Tax=Arthrobacter castelli TaxID=271431 RepID=UPI00047EA866|nr:GNAT family N-acetyltransferase [Arthrobacter castelli]